MQNDDEKAVFKMNESNDCHFVNSFNNITTLPLNKGHILHYVEILTSDISGITYAYIINNEKQTTLLDLTANQLVSVEIYANEGYKIDSVSIEYRYSYKHNVKKNYAIIDFLRLRDNVKIYVTASTVNESGETIYITDEKLKDKQHKLYYYDKINYKYREAAKDRIGCVYIKKGNISDKLPDVNEKTCANNHHIHNDYIYINSENYLTGIDLISCGSFD